MISFPGDTRKARVLRLVARTAVVFALLAPTHVVAQVTGPPVGIVPSGPAPEEQTGDEGGTPDVFGRTPEETRRFRSIGARPGMEDGGVQVGTLGSVDISSTGAPPPPGSGFGTNLWAGSQASAVTSLLKDIPVATKSFAFNDLTRRLLMSAGKPPAGNLADGSLLLLRVDRLFEAGDHFGIEQLTEQLPPSLLDERLMKSRTDALLMDGRDDQACETAGEMRKVGESLHWGMMAAYCQILLGNTAPASITTEMVRERGGEDQLFFELMTHLLYDTPYKPKKGTEFEPIHFAMMRRLGVDLLTVSDAASASPSVLRMLSLTSTLSVEDRLPYIEQAVQKGVMGVEQLQRAYAQIQFTESEIADAKNAAAEKKPALAQALLYQAAGLTQSQNQIIDILTFAWDQAEKNNIYPVIARVNAKATEAVTPNLDVAWTSRHFIRALLTIGNDDLAYDWYELVDPRFTTVRLANTNVLHQLESDLRISRPSERLPWTEQSLLDLIESARQQSSFDPSIMARTGLKLHLLDALGFDVPVQVWERLGVPQQSPFQSAVDAGLLSSLEQAAFGGRVGETVLLGLKVVGPEGPAKAHPDAVRYFVRALVKVGLQDDARAVALEAALGQGAGSTVQAQN